jgi:large subunit ribosomal protein L3
MLGLIGRKVGMTQIFSEEGHAIPVTVLKVEKNVVVSKKNIDRDGYSALLVGAENIKDKKVNLPKKGLFRNRLSKIAAVAFEEQLLAKVEKDADKKYLNDVYQLNGALQAYTLDKKSDAVDEDRLTAIFTDCGFAIKPKRLLKEFRFDGVEQYDIGQEIGLELLEGVSHVDVTSQSKGKGFQGVMKRHGFGGGPAGHGSKFHRQNGSTGNSAWPSRVFKGIKRAGRMGNDKVTVQNLKVVKVDNEKDYVLIKGCVPGTKHSVVYIKQAKKKTK